MPQSFAESLSWVPKSRGLAATLALACDYARSHHAVTLEHLLLALLSDADASAVLQACSIDLGRLNADVTSYLAGMSESLPPGAPSEPAASPDLLRILEYASAAAQQSRRRDVNGAIVLAAVVGDGRSPSASMLRTQGLTFEEAVRALQKASAAGRSAGPPPAAPGPSPAAPPPRQADAQAAAEELPQGMDRASAPAWEEGERERLGDPRHVNGATGQSTEEILATARRRVDAGRTGSQQTTAAQANAPGPAEPGGAPERRELDRHQPQEPALPTPYDEAPEEEAPAPPARPPAPAPVPQPPRAARPRPRGPEDDPAPPGASSAHPHDRYRPDWSPGPPAGGHYHQQQPARGLEPSHPPAPPPRSHPLPRQNPPHVHPAPLPPRYPPEPPRPMPMHAPWPEPPPPPPFPPGAGNRATPAAAARPSADARRKGAATTEPRPGTPVSAGQLVENIPRTMTVWLPETVEVRIAKADVAALAQGLQGVGAAYRHDVVVTKAMSVRLRAPNGGFWIETASPETQWIENTLGLLSDDYASWRWTVTPRRRGKARLQLVVSARTVGADGLAAETALPDQVIEVKVRTNYGRTAVQWGGWLAAAVAGGLLARFGEGLWEVGRAMLIQLGAI
ncbi:MAG: Clp protease [Hyphomicrobiaceae bacterium]|nr:Clp protease [Hyphomicrobiaceae bacterium]